MRPRLYDFRVHVFFFGRAAWLAGSQFPDQGLNTALAVKEPSPNHWTAKEFLSERMSLMIYCYILIG